LVPWSFTVAPAGSIAPWAPAVAVSVCVLMAKLASSVWLAVTFVNA
jgi:hypothetical protein